MANNRNNKIFETGAGVESAAGLKEWCAIDATYGKVPLPKQLKSAAKAWKPTREFAATIMLKQAAEVR